MSRVSTFGLTEPPPTANTSSQSLRDVDIDQFLQLMITELQNQDPLNPLDNSELLAQISQIREISSTDQLSETLSAVTTGQNLSTASSLIGKRIQALTKDAQEINGVVDRVTVGGTKDDNGQRELRIHIGEHQVKLDNVREIVDHVEDQ